MAVIASSERLYFTSTLYTVSSGIKLADIPQESIRAIIDEALTISIGTYSYSSGYSEISCLELF